MEAKTYKELNKCGVGFGVVVVMEVTKVEMRNTRDQAIAEDNSGAVKRRKLSNHNTRSMFMETKGVDCEISVNSEEQINGACDAEGSDKSGCVPVCCCSSARSTEKPKVSDLKDTVETEITARHDSDKYQSTRRSQFKAEAGQLTPAETTEANHSTKMKNSREKVLVAAKMPSEAELEDFFEAAQEGLNERFKNKYNYDIVNDIPLKGRFEWVQVTQEK